MEGLLLELKQLARAACGRGLRSCRASPAGRLLRLDSLGLCGPCAGTRILLHQQLPLRSPGRELPVQGFPDLERHKPHRPPRGDRRRPLRLRPLRLPGLEGRHRASRRLQDAGRSELRAEGDAQVFCRRPPPHARPDPPRRGRRPLQGRPHELLWFRSRVHPPLQPPAHLAPPDRSVLDSDGLYRRGSLHRRPHRQEGPQGPGGFEPHPLRRPLRGGGGEPPWRAPGPAPAPWEAMVLVRLPGLGIPRDRPGLAVRPGCRPPALGAPPLPRNGRRSSSPRPWSP